MKRTIVKRRLRIQSEIALWIHLIIIENYVMRN